MVGIIEIDERIPNGNYGSRKEHSIYDLTLENLLLCDYNTKNMEPTIQNFTDLESFYDRQLASVCGVVEETTEDEI